MKKALKWIGGIVGSLFLLLVLIGYLAGPTTPEQKRQMELDKIKRDSLALVQEALEAQRDSLKRADEIAKEVRKKEEDDCLTAYVIAERILKKALKDPDSYEEIAHESYVVKATPGESTYIQVMLHYRAKNSFGGFVVNKKYFNFSKSLNLIDTFDK